MKNIIMVLTSHSQLGSTGKTTGFWLEEFAAPYYAFKDAGVNPILCSIKGGQPPIDPTSQDETWQTSATRRYLEDEQLQKTLRSTTAISAVQPDDSDALFFPGGHGPMWDMPENPEVSRLIEAFNQSGKPIAAVCHGVAALIGPKTLEQEPMVQGKQLCCFSNSEEEAVGLMNAVPFLLQNRLEDLGAHVKNAQDFSNNVVQDGQLITGQNPQSSKSCAELLLKAL